MRQDISNGLPKPEQLEVYCEYYLHTVVHNGLQEITPLTLYQQISSSHLIRGFHTTRFMEYLNYKEW